MRKLTDEQLSRVLGQQAIGKLVHADFYRPDDGCGCVAGAALDIGGSPWFGHVSKRARDVSNAIQGDKWCFDVIYPETPEALLAFLAEKGLA